MNPDPSKDDDQIIVKNLSFIYESIYKSRRDEITTILGKEGKIKGILSRSQNKLADSVMRLMGKETLED